MYTECIWMGEQNDSFFLSLTFNKWTSTDWLIDWLIDWLACAGDYQVLIKFNDQSIPDSPFDVYVAPSGADSTRLDTTDLDQLVCQVGPSHTVHKTASLFLCRRQIC